LLISAPQHSAKTPFLSSLKQVNLSAKSGGKKVTSALTHVSPSPPAPISQS